VTDIAIERTIDVPDSEEQTVLLWRREQFGRLGFGPVDARILAESSADLGDARRLRTAGCPLDLAFRILV
jgi:hypothetical protein